MKDLYLLLLIVLSCIFIYNLGTTTKKEHFTDDEIQLDAVITYVNDNDPKWLKQKSDKKEKGETINSRKGWRFSNSNEIKYCLLSIEKRCSFFRNIFIAIAIPSQKCDISFLSPETQKKIKFVTHKEFYYTQEHLPTFNSMSIEHNIHNIPGLSEYFVYFNDDCFVVKTLTKDDFIKDGKIIIHKEDAFVSPKGEPTEKEAGYFSAWKNTNKMLDNLFKPEERMLIKHVPQIQIKSVHKKLKELFPKQFEITSSSKFRNIHCNLMSAGLAEYYSLYNNLAITGSCVGNCKYIQVFVDSNVKRNKEIVARIKREKPTFLNIQSAVKDDYDIEEIYKEIFVV